MARQRTGRERQLGPRAIRQRHERQGQPLQRVAIKTDGDVVGQSRQRVGKRFACMAHRLEAEFIHQRRKCRAQQRHFVWRRGKARTGPHARMNGQRGYVLAGTYGHDDEIQQHVPMHTRKPAGLDDQWRALAFLKPGKGGVQ